MTKRTIILLALLCTTLGAIAQDKVRNISVEALGAQNTIGINYDTRLHGNSGWGYRIGIGFGYGNSDSFFEETTIKGVGIPLEMNYLFGKKNSKLEVGVGTSIGVYRIKEGLAFYYESTLEHPEGIFETHYNNDTRFGYFFFGNIGYRYQRPKGFVFRTGFTPSFSFGKCGLTRSFFYPYISFGWSF